MEGQREARRQAGHAQLPGVSAPLSVCALSLSLLFQQTSSFSSSGEALWEIQMNQTHPSLFSRVPFFPSSRPCICPPAFPVSLSLCPSLCSVSLCLSPHPQVYVHVSLSLSLPPPLPAPLSPSLNHLNHCVLATQPRLSGSSNTPRGDNPESHTHLDASAVTARPQTPSRQAPNSPLRLSLLKHW